MILGDRTKLSVDKYQMDVLRKVWLEDNEIVIEKEQRVCLDIFGNSCF